MNITDLKVTDMPVETINTGLTLPTEIKDPNPFVFTGCKAIMLEDFDSLPIITTIESASVAAVTGL
ncbi:hypothetical protein [Moorena sp. SIO3H5]|uniref:hypothetical protein n=1 Tax=Moorena sp. SIO3H5 TaxID=2607834 RepID=UPI0013BCEB9B|nr:hypothetical protein [Moorena sp. SIO3H5]NEO71781.1 hypothetical protein [Moorena sp. SIO3H5]